MKDILFGHLSEVILFFNLIQQTHNKDLSATDNLIGPDDIKISISIHQCSIVFSLFSKDCLEEELYPPRMYNKIMGTFNRCSVNCSCSLLIIEIGKGFPACKLEHL